jgi:hypothetical protein
VSTDSLPPAGAGGNTLGPRPRRAFLPIEEDDEVITCEGHEDVYAAVMITTWCTAAGIPAEVAAKVLYIAASCCETFGVSLNDALASGWLPEPSRGRMAAGAPGEEADHG